MVQGLPTAAGAASATPNAPPYNAAFQKRGFRSGLRNAGVWSREGLPWVCMTRRF